MRTLALFRNTREVIKAERLMNANAMPGKIIPVPREISSECGMAIEINLEVKHRFLTLLNANMIPVQFHESMDHL